MGLEERQQPKTPETPPNPLTILTRMRTNRARGEEMDTVGFFQDVSALIEVGVTREPEISQLLRSLGREGRICTALLENLRAGHQNQDREAVLKDLEIAGAFGMEENPQIAQLLSFLRNKYEEAPPITPPPTQPAGAPPTEPLEAAAPVEPRTESIQLREPAITEPSETPETSDAALSARFWQREHLPDEKEMMVRVIHESASAGKLGVFIYPESSENTQEKLAAYKQLARELGYEVGEFTIPPYEGSYSAIATTPIRKISPEPLEAEVAITPEEIEELNQDWQTRYGRRLDPDTAEHLLREEKTIETHFAGELPPLSPLPPILPQTNPYGMNSYLFASADNALRRLLVDKYNPARHSESALIDAIGGTQFARANREGGNLNDLIRALNANTSGVSVRKTNSLNEILRAAEGGATAIVPLWRPAFAAANHAGAILPGNQVTRGPRGLHVRVIDPLQTSARELPLRSLTRSTTLVTPSDPDFYQALILEKREAELVPPPPAPHRRQGP